MSKLSSMEKKIEASNSKIKRFGDLLDSLATTDEKKKMLWKEIYENAVVDREAAYVLYTQLFSCLSGNSQDHMTLGSTMVKYLERMGKSNEQLLKLADLIAASEKESVSLSEDDVFDAIGEN